MRLWRQITYSITNLRLTPSYCAPSGWAVMPTQCVVFEDADFGLQAARAAGMDAVDVRLL
ncbi:Phosphatase YqaB [Salmonella enterica subsp. enterica]|nr:Phosphatase YqaB [Salmonella enterica subsp. enterica]